MTIEKKEVGRISRRTPVRRGKKKKVLSLLGKKGKKRTSSGSEKRGASMGVSGPEAVLPEKARSTSLSRREEEKGKEEKKGEKKINFFPQSEGGKPEKNRTFPKLFQSKRGTRQRTTDRPEKKGGGPSDREKWNCRPKSKGIPETVAKNLNGRKSSIILERWGRKQPGVLLRKSAATVGEPSREVHNL